MFFVSWTNGALLRYAREEWAEDVSIGKSLFAKSLLYVAGVLSAFIIIIFLESHVVKALDIKGNILPWIMMGVISIPLSEMGIYANVAMGRSLPYGYIQFIKQSFFFAGIAAIPLLMIKPTLYYLAGLMVAGTFISGILSFGILPSRAWKNFMPNRRFIVDIVRYSWAVPFGALSSFVVNWVDIWVIRAYMSTEEVGLYAWAYMITSLVPLVFAPFAALFTPAMVDARVSRNHDPIRKLGQFSLRAMLLLSVFGIVALPLVNPALKILMGERYLTTYPVLIVLLSAIPFQFLSYLITPIGNAFENLISRIVFVSAFVAVVNVIGDVLLVPLIGITGAALTTSAVFALSSLLVVIVLRRWIDGLPDLWRFLGTGLIMPSGVLVLLMFGNSGSIICLIIAIGIVLVARSNDFFSKEDARFVESQKINKKLKVLIVTTLRWLAKESS